jgi:hypothetical protein
VEVVEVTEQLLFEKLKRLYEQAWSGKITIDMTNGIIVNASIPDYFIKNKRPVLKQESTVTNRQSKAK